MFVYLYLYFCIFLCLYIRMIYCILFYMPTPYDFYATICEFLLGCHFVLSICTPLLIVSLMFQNTSCPKNLQNLQEERLQNTFLQRRKNIWIGDMPRHQIPLATILAEEYVEEGWVVVRSRG